jgi:hypothetical protein
MEHIKFINKPTNSVGNTLHTSKVANRVMTRNWDTESDKLALLETVWNISVENYAQ